MAKPPYFNEVSDRGLQDHRSDPGSQGPETLDMAYLDPILRPSLRPGWLAICRLEGVLANMAPKGVQNDPKIGSK